MDPDAGDPIRGEADPFSTLGLPVSFGVSADDVEAAYLRRAAVLHPDLAGGDPSKAADAARGMAALNAARRTLLDAEARAGAVASLAGVPTAEACKDLPDGFLMEILETRMAIEAAAGGDRGDIEHWRGWAAAELASYAEAFAGMIGSLTEGDAEAARSVREHLNAWRYIKRLAAQLPVAERGSDPGGPAEGDRGEQAGRADA